MSAQYPIVAITGSSGAGTTTAMSSFQHIFRREGIKAQVLEGDSMHRFNRMEMRAELKKRTESGNNNFSHFGPEANLLKELEEIFQRFAQTGKGKVRKYIHDAAEGSEFHQEPGTFTPWNDMRADADLLFYEGLHGGYVQEAVVDTILRRMPDYINHICPQFSRSHVNFQRVPTVDTSNPFIANDIPSPDESMVVIRFANPKGIDFPYLLSMLHNSMMTRPNTLVIPGGKIGLAMQLIFTPMILRLMDRKRRA